MQFIASLKWTKFNPLSIIAVTLIYFINFYCRLIQFSLSHLSYMQNIQGIVID